MEQELRHLKQELALISDESKTYFKLILQQLSRIAHLNPNDKYLKLLSSNLQEYADSIDVFQPYHNYPKVCLFGSARTSANTLLYQLSESISKQLSDAGFMIITGAGPGIMEAGNKGAQDQGFGLNILLPFEQESNPFIRDSDKLVSYKYFFLRKLMFVKESQATVLFPGGFGTFDEAFELLTLIQTGRTSPRPIVLFDEPGSIYWKRWIELFYEQLLDTHYISKDDLLLFQHFQSITPAVNYIQTFYRVYHSIRYLDDYSIIYLNCTLSLDFVASLNEQFSHILTEGHFSYHKADHNPCPLDSTSPTPCLTFSFDKKQFSTLVLLIDALNKFDSSPRNS
ncbi:MAG: TIGR00730 family Rossman fold protein [bacterium]